MLTKRLNNGVEIPIWILRDAGKARILFLLLCVLPYRSSSITRMP